MVVVQGGVLLVVLVIIVGVILVMTVLVTKRCLWSWCRPHWWT